MTDLSPLAADASETSERELDMIDSFLASEERERLIRENARLETRTEVLSRLSARAPLGSLEHQGKPHRKRFSHWYEAIIDWMLVNPGGSLRDCAKALQRPESTVYIVTNSSIFKQRYAQRRAEHSALLSASLIDRQEMLALDVLTELHSRVKENPAKISTSTLSEVANSTLQRLGYGAPQPASGAPTVNVNIDAKVIEEARAMARAQQSKLIEHGEQ